MTTLYQISNSTTLTPTITNASLIAAAARQSTPVDFGTPRTPNWDVRCNAIMNTAPTAGQTLDVYVAWSSGTGAGIWGGNLGITDSAYTGYGSVANSVGQLDFVGSLVLSNNATPSGQISDIGVITPKLQYGIFVLHNNSSANLSADTSNNNNIVCIPIVDAGV